MTSASRQFGTDEPVNGNRPPSPVKTGLESNESGSESSPEIAVVGSLESTRHRQSCLSYHDLQKASREVQPHPELPQKLPTGYQRVRIEDDESFHAPELTSLLRMAIDIRHRYFNSSLKCDGAVIEDEKDPFRGPVPGKSSHVFEMVNGVVTCWETPDRSKPPLPVRTVQQFYQDLDILCDIVADGPTKSFCYKRLQILDARFLMHVTLNQRIESEAQKLVPHRDFYNVRKVDNHVHHSACMNQKHLLRFIKRKLREDGNLPCTERDGQILTLREVFNSLNLTEYDLNIDALDMHAHQDSFHRFDKFNLKYNPIGETRLREIFLKTDNRIKGRFLAEITQEVFSDLEANKYQFAEYRLSIYGRSMKEWNKLAAWVYDNKLYHANVRWMIQIPRLYSVYKSAGIVQRFQEVIDNIFLPLFHVSIDPSYDIKLHNFLKLVASFDTVDDESQREPVLNAKLPLPEDWDLPINPPYSMWSYYIFANLQALNHIRKARGFNTFSYRPHAGEAGDVDHLAVAFMTAESIAHGVMLRKSPVLQYLFYLTQIGISLSPLSNNMLFVPYDKNPFPRLFSRGLKVTISTDDPLMIHFTKEPLLEEYSVATQVWKLSSVDMCEIACTSVQISGFPDRCKSHWLGPSYRLVGADSNDIKSTNVPDVRVAFRREMFEAELSIVYGTDAVKRGETMDPRIWNPMFPF
ncbi:AMP deaminase [Plasmodiophora brassicae]|uniref:AMP deaminase n=1 Tax=Plasmodiophora brassicae TaxID=37360 RepID=A0A0G4J8V0_PLABS|nr:hypothetical protein PBRA_003401 [Plasmodiophora brassicae]SPQ99751.1 unnamed protein product [Plasmodiophora brassicae]